MHKCPYCFDDVTPETLGKECPHCKNIIVDDLLKIDYPDIDKKACTYCGKKINKPAIYCKFCEHWLDELKQSLNDFEALEDE